MVELRLYCSVCGLICTSLSSSQICGKCRNNKGRVQRYKKENRRFTPRTFRKVREHPKQKRLG